MNHTSQSMEYHRPTTEAHTTSIGPRIQRDERGIMSIASDHRNYRDADQ